MYIAATASHSQSNEKTALLGISVGHWYVESIKLLILERKFLDIQLCEHLFDPCIRL